MHFHFSLHCAPSPPLLIYATHNCNIAELSKLAHPMLRLGSVCGSGFPLSAQAGWVLEAKVSLGNNRPLAQFLLRKNDIILVCSEQQQSCRYKQGKMIRHIHNGEQRAKWPNCKMVGGCEEEIHHIRMNVLLDAMRSGSCRKAGREQQAAG